MAFLPLFRHKQNTRDAAVGVDCVLNHTHGPVFQRTAVSNHCVDRLHYKPLHRLVEVIANSSLQVPQVDSDLVGSDVYEQI